MKDILNELERQSQSDLHDDFTRSLLAEAAAEIKRLRKDAELWRKHSPAIQQMLAALDTLSPLVLTRLKLQDAAMQGANDAVKPRSEAASA